MSACHLSPCALSPSDSRRMGTPVNVRGHILYTPRAAESLQSLGHSRVRKSWTRCASSAPRRVVPASGGTGESEALEEFCKPRMRRPAAPSGRLLRPAAGGKGPARVGVRRGMAFGLWIAKQRSLGRANTDLWRIAGIGPCSPNDQSELIEKVAQATELTRAAAGQAVKSHGTGHCRRRLGRRGGPCLRLREFRSDEACGAPWAEPVDWREHPNRSQQRAAVSRRQDGQRRPQSAVSAEGSQEEDGTGKESLGAEVRRKP
jgi:hypothetical protein